MIIAVRRWLKSIKLETYVTCTTSGFILFAVLLFSISQEIGYPWLFPWVVGPVGLATLGGWMIGLLLSLSGEANDR